MFLQERLTESAAKLPYVSPEIKDYGSAQAITKSGSTTVSYVTTDSVAVTPPVYYHS